MAPREYVAIGPAPAIEHCAQPGTPDYSQQAKAECRRFIACIRHKLGAEPDGATLTYRSFPHQCGDRCYEVVCYFVPADERAVEYAFTVEANAPIFWEDLHV